MNVSTVSSKGQVTIPKEVRDALRVEAGDRVVFVLREGGVVELRPASVDLLDLVGVLEPEAGRHVTTEQMNEGVARAVADRFTKSRRR
jgi:antitoxin PrlF